MTLANKIAEILRKKIKCDATGLAPAVASVFLVGFEEATAELSALMEAETAGLRSALEPFAREADDFEADDPVVHYGDSYELWQGRRTRINVGDLRRARQAINPETER